MATVRFVFTLEYVAEMLEEDVDLLQAIIYNDDNLTHGNIITVVTGHDQTTSALTDDGIDELRQIAGRRASISRKMARIPRMLCRRPRSRRTGQCNTPHDNNRDVTFKQVDGMKMNKNYDNLVGKDNGKLSIVIMGAGGLASELNEAILAMSDAGEAVRCEAFFVERGFAVSPYRSIPVWDDWSNLTSCEFKIVIGIGDISARQRLTKLITHKIGADRFVSIVHPSVQRGRSVNIGEGSMLLGPMSLTANIQIGEHVLINPGCTIAHDCEIGDFSSLSPGVSIAGNVTIGKGCFLGTGSIVVPNVSIGDGAMIGAGSVVLKDVLAGDKVFGIPATVRP